MNFNTHKREGMSSSPRETSPKKQKLDKTGQRDGNGDSERKAQEQTNEAEMNEEEQEEDEEEYEEGFLEEESTTTLSGNGPLSAVYVLFRHDKLERLRTVLLTHGVPEESPAFLTAPDAKDLTIKCATQDRNTVADRSRHSSDSAHVLQAAGDRADGAAGQRHRKKLRRPHRGDRQHHPQQQRAGPDGDQRGARADPGQRVHAGTVDRAWCTCVATLPSQPHTSTASPFNSSP